MGWITRWSMVGPIQDTAFALLVRVMGKPVFTAPPVKILSFYYNIFTISVILLLLKGENKII